jgi:hypothetical protein
MDESASAREMLARSIAAMTDDGKLTVEELEYILEAGLEDGRLDAQEKAMLFRIISRLTASDFSTQLWNRVERLIEQYDLDGDEPMRM